MHPKVVPDFPMLLIICCQPGVLSFVCGASNLRLCWVLISNCLSNFLLYYYPITFFFKILVWMSLVLNKIWNRWIGFTVLFRLSLLSRFEDGPAVHIQLSCLPSLFFHVILHEICDEQMSSIWLERAVPCRLIDKDGWPLILPPLLRSL